MALALTKVTAYGVEADEAVTKRFRQFLIMEGTAANTDATYDLSANAGTFFTAVGTAAGSVGETLLNVLKEMSVRALCFLDAQGTGLASRSKTQGSLVVIDGVVGSGSASPAVVATGILTTDTIVAVTQNIKGANSLPLLGYDTVTADAFVARYSADPGAGAHLKTIVERTGGAPLAGQYSLTLTSHRPDITFKSGDAPTTFKIVLSWALIDSAEPVNAYKAA